MNGNGKNRKKKFHRNLHEEFLGWGLHRLSEVWKSSFCFIGNHNSAKKEITLCSKPYNEYMHPMV